MVVVLEGGEEGGCGDWRGRGVAECRFEGRLDCTILCYVGVGGLGFGEFGGGGDCVWIYS